MFKEKYAISIKFDAYFNTSQLPMDSWNCFALRISYYFFVVGFLNFVVFVETLHSYFHFSNFNLTLSKHIQIVQIGNV